MLGRNPIQRDRRASGIWRARPGYIACTWRSSTSARSQRGAACSPANSTVPAARRPFSIGVATNLPSKDVVGVRGPASGPETMTW